VPLPDREPAAIRAAVARLDPAALARFEAGWTAATARARDEYSLLPARYFVEHWFNWVAVARWPELAARLRACVGRLQQRLARSCGRPRPSGHEPVDVGVRPGHGQWPDPAGLGWLAALTRRWLYRCR
jgi:hypothetical protein